MCEPDEDDLVEAFLDASEEEIAESCADIVRDVLRTTNSADLFTPEEVETLARLTTATNLAAIFRRKLGLD